MYNLTPLAPLPFPLMVFRNSAIVYINPFFQNLLSIDEFIEKDPIFYTLMSELLDTRVTDDSMILEFFSVNDYFQHDGQWIQIHLNPYDDNIIVAFTQIHEDFTKKEKTKDRPLLNSEALEQSDTILSLFKDLRGSTIQLLSFYKGLPIFNQATVEALRNNCLQVKVSPKQLINEKDDRIFFFDIVHKSRPFHFVCEATKFNQKLSTIELSSFRLLKKTHKVSQNYNLKLDNKVSAIIRVGKENHTVQIYGLTRHTVSLITTKKELFDEIELGEVHRMNFLKAFGVNSSVRTEVIRKKVIDDIYKIKVAPIDIALLEKPLNKFFMKRQIEILKEINIFTTRLSNK